MLIPPPRTRDGRVVDAARTEPHALLVSIDRPTKPDVSAFSGEVARFEGWALSLDPEPRIRVLVDGVLEREFNLASPRLDVLDFLGHDDPRDPQGFEFDLPLVPPAGTPRTVVIEVEDDRHVAVSPTFRFHHSPSLALHDDYVDSAPTAAHAVRHASTQLGVATGPATRRPVVRLSVNSSLTCLALEDIDHGSGRLIGWGPVYSVEFKLDCDARERREPVERRVVPDVNMDVEVLLSTHRVELLSD